MIEVNNVSMRFNMAKEKHESLKEYFLAAVQGKLQFEEFYALRDVSLTVVPPLISWRMRSSHFS